MKRVRLELLFLLLAINTFLNADRVKRRVVFKQNSKFFIRLNGKTSVLNSTGIFAHGWAVRINYDLPDTIPKINRIFKRDLGPPREENKFSSLATSCVFKHFCQLLTSFDENSRCGFFCGIRNVIYSSKGPKAAFLKTFLENCHLYDQECLMNSDSGPF